MVACKLSLDRTPHLTFMHPRPPDKHPHLLRHPMVHEDAVPCRGDQMHLVHIIPRMQLAAVYGAPPVDFLPQQDPVAYEQLVAKAERFVAARFMTLLQGLQPEPVAHIIKVRTACTLLHSAASVASRLYSGAAAQLWFDPRLMCSRRSTPTPSATSSARRRRTCTPWLSSWHLTAKAIFSNSSSAGLCSAPPLDACDLELRYLLLEIRPCSNHVAA